MEISRYRQLNENFTPVLAYHLGRRSGFFAEYVNMLQAMLYCLQNNIQFQLYSKDANFAVSEGWTDFFEPFCPEQTSPLHLVFNPRFPTPKFRFKLRKAAAPLVKTLCRCDHLSYELWTELRANDFEVGCINLPSFNLQASAIEIYREINQMIWRPKPPIREHINALLRRLNLPKTYCAIHIRSGDKIKEAKPYTLGAYMDKLAQLDEVKNVLVLTDDYSNYKKLVVDYPMVNFYTLERKDLVGYQHRINKRRSKQQKYTDYIEFLAGVTAASKANNYLGTYSSSVSTFLRLRMEAEKCHAIDRP